MTAMLSRPAAYASSYQISMGLSLQHDAGITGRRVVSTSRRGAHPFRPPKEKGVGSVSTLLGGLSVVPAIAVRCSGAAVTEQFEACRGRIRLGCSGFAPGCSALVFEIYGGVPASCWRSYRVFGAATITQIV